MSDNGRLFITRKRKKWKFAHFDEWPNCLSQSEVRPERWPSPLTVEIAAGTADLALELARREAGRQLVAVDIKSDRLYTGAKQALAEGLTNITFVRAHLGSVGELFAARSVGELWLTFPDPFPRKRQAKHRLTHPDFLRRFAPLLSAEGRLYFKTDNRPLFLWSLEQLVAQGWRLCELSFDLHESPLAERYKITTAYERRFLAEGIPINFLSALPPLTVVQ